MEAEGDLAMKHVTHDPGHARVVVALGRLGASYRDRASSYLSRIGCCNSRPSASLGEGLGREDVRTPSGSKVQHGWHCNSPLCHRAAVSKAEKFFDKYLSRAMTRIRFQHHALTLTTVPVAGQSLREAYWVAENARRSLFKDAEFKRAIVGGMWRIEFTAGDRGYGRSWFVHVHVMGDANLNRKRQSRIQYLWSQYVLAAGGDSAPVKNYTAPVENVSAYMRYLRKDLDYSEWTDKELMECLRFLLSARAPVFTGVYGSWNDRTKEGRPYAAAKRRLVKKTKKKTSLDIPNIDFTDIKLASHVTKEAGKDVLLAIYPAVRGHGMDVNQAAAAELLCVTVGRFFRKMRWVLRSSEEVVGVRTGTVYRRGDVLPVPRPPVKPSKLFGRYSEKSIFPV